VFSTPTPSINVAKTTCSLESYIETRADTVLSWGMSDTRINKPRDHRAATNIFSGTDMNNVP
jgi:hypothetical protein